ncbi:MAG TPA: hypothetical protein V6C57_21950, partial [Coleofasciculaceae cyanobacterium]
MGGAILSMHYTGMAATVFIPQPDKVIELRGIDNTLLTYLVCNLTVLILSLMIVVLRTEKKRSH